MEELAKACGTTSVIVCAHTSLCSYPIYAFGTEEQKMKYLPDLLLGRNLGAFGLTEPNAGSDASGQQTIAERVGDHYVLNGSKCFITNATEASSFVVFAMTDKYAGNHGISAFIVEKDFPGFSIGKRLSQFQNTQFQLADMKTRADAAQMLVYRAACAKDSGDPNTGLYSSMAKLFAAEMASDVTRRAVQFFGGYGYTREYPVERMMRDAKIPEIYEGTSEIRRMVISRDIGVK